MRRTQFHLLRSRRFAPLFVTQFLGAMNDNLFKQSLVILITFQLAGRLGLDARILVTVAAGLFIVPFFLFSATAGQLADKFEKARSIRLIKVFEILIMGLAVGAFALEQPYLLLGVLFLMGTQSAFFGPLKYGILPSHLRDHELIGGNALIEGATFLAILFGTIAGGLVILSDGGVAIISISIVALAVLGWIASTFIPNAESPAPDLRINPNLIGETWHLVRLAAKKRSVFLSILGISWFWVVGATFLTQFPNFTKDVLGADETVVSLFMAVFSIGIAAGALMCNRLLDGEISARYVPLAALGLTLFILDLYFATGGSTPPPGELADAAAFMGQAANWRILADLFLIALCGGLYTVPLYAILQHDSEEAERARTIAGNNILNALFMVVGAVAATLMLGAEMSVPQVFLVLAIVNAAAAVYLARLLQEAAAKTFLVASLFVAAVIAISFIPPIPQDPDYHRFADGRRFLGIPNFGDVVSNGGFLVVGLWGLSRVLGPGKTGLFDDPLDALPYGVFFAGVTLIGVGSVAYHVAPDNETLFWDRLPMTIAFMALFAAVIADRIHRRAGIVWLLPLLVTAGALSLLYWRQTELAGVGDLRFYGMVQFFPLLAIAVIFRLFPEHRYTPAGPLVWAMLWYGAAKVCETFDREIFALLGGNLSGHSLKHLLAGIAVYWVLNMVVRSNTDDRG